MKKERNLCKWICVVFVSLFVLVAFAKGSSANDLWDESSTCLNSDSTEKMAGRVKNTTLFPYNNIALLVIRWDDGIEEDVHSYKCTGFFLLDDSELVVTAGHCLRNQEDGRLTSYVEVWRAYNPWSETPRPYGLAIATEKIYVFDGEETDWGFIVLDRFSNDVIPVEDTMDYKTHEELIIEGECPNGWFYGKFFTTAGYPYYEFHISYVEELTMYEDEGKCFTATDYILYFDFNFFMAKRDLPNRTKWQSCVVWT